MTSTGDAPGPSSASTRVRPSGGITRATRKLVIAAADLTIGLALTVRRGRYAGSQCLSCGDVRPCDSDSVDPCGADEAWPGLRLNSPSVSAWVDSSGLVVTASGCPKLASELRTGPRRSRAVRCHRLGDDTRHLQLAASRRLKHVFVTPADAGVQHWIPAVAGMTDRPNALGGSRRSFTGGPSASPVPTPTERPREGERLL